MSTSNHTIERKEEKHGSSSRQLFSEQCSQTNPIDTTVTMPRAQHPNEPTAIKQYRSVLRHFMAHKNSINYPDDYEFSDAELGDV